jgi:cysteine-rich repeat protein
MGPAWAVAPQAEENAAPAARLGVRLERALERPLPAAGLRIAVALRDEGLPPPGAARRAAVHARQQRALDAIPAASFDLGRRYESVNGFAGRAQRAAVEALLAHDGTAFVYLDGTVQATLQQGAGLVGASAAHANGATGSGVRVAVLDTGIDSDHPHLVDDLVAQQCFCDNHPSPNRGCCPNRKATQANAEDDEGHGTSVAGIITSSRAAGPGIAPDAEIVAVKVLDSGGGGSWSDIAAGLDWVLTNRASLGIRVVNMSLGDGSEIDDPSLAPCTGTNTANAIASLHADGVSVFVSSGNDGHDEGIAFPACVAEAISVGGVYDAAVGPVSWCGNAQCTTTLCTDDPTAADTFVCHSNSGGLLDLLAPDWRTDTTALGGGTEGFGGTSASSPYAAAQAALLLEVDGTLTPEDVRSLLSTHGTAVVNPDNGLSFTRSDVAAALVAIAPALCGNSAVESGETCDDGNTVGGDCCSDTCQLEPSGSVCRAAAGACDLAETCTGSDPQCPADVKSTAECRAAAGACDVAESCDGSGDACPMDALEPASTPCRAAAGVCDLPEICTGSDPQCPADVKSTAECRAVSGACDVAEMCDGVGVACPVDAFLPVGTECRSAAGVCDLTEACTGADAQCPADVLVPDGTSCEEGDACTDGDTCTAGACVAGPDLDCDDADACTADSCDAVLGCAHEPIPDCPAAIPAAPSRTLALLALSLMGTGVVILRERSRRARL